jgi:hypothetical protein
VRDGEDRRLYGGKHTRIAVYSEMLLNVLASYSLGIDYRTMTENEIEFFYDGLRSELKEATKPTKPKRS